MSDLAFMPDVSPSTREDWLRLVEGVLKGADFERKLVSRTYDGIRIEPLYPKADGALTGRATSGPWRVSQRIDHPDSAAANELALADLAGGADALTLVLDGAPAARGFGLAVNTLDDLDRALEGVMLDLIHVRLDAGGRGRQAAALLIALAERRGQTLANLQFDLGLDPIGAMAAGGRLSASWETVSRRSAETLADLQARGFAGRAFLADGRPYHEAGASEAQELAAVLATGLAHLRALEVGGHDLDTARNALSFLLVADADEFLTVAKFRALRRLWARVEEACGLAPKPIRLHAETAWRMTTRRDPFVNILRATVAVFSAGIGGADAITVLPFTAALGLPDAFARRVARNTQIVLIEESNLGRVLDPAAGSGGFEALTDELCGRAWSLFQEIEREAGIVESLTRGALQARIGTVRAERERNLARRKDPITGTSEFPNLNEPPVAVLMPFPVTKPGVGGAAASGAPAGAPVQPFAALVEAAVSGVFMGELAPAGGEAVAVERLPSIRAAEGFERLRDLSDEVLARTGSRPRLFLANLGPIPAFTARATFAKNFFESGGIEAITNDGFSSMEALTAAYKKSNAKLSCICSSDDIYVTQAISAVEALRNAGCDHIYLAGRAGDQEDALRQAGVTQYIFAGCDVVRTLENAFREASPSAV